MAGREGIEKPLSRRGFLRTLLGSSLVITLGGIFTPVIGYLWPPRSSAAAGENPVLVGTTDELTVGKGKVVAYAGKPVVVFNARDVGIRAFSAVCTHLRCTVYWCEEHQYIHCPCHDGIFDVNGQVISGPPPSPLFQYNVALKDNQIYVTGKMA